MKKTWNSPEVQELTIQATAFGYNRPNFGWDGNRPNRKPGWDDNRGSGNDDICRCQGGTSPCDKHHGWDEDFES